MSEFTQRGYNNRISEYMCCLNGPLKLSLKQLNATHSYIYINYKVLSLRFIKKKIFLELNDGPFFANLISLKFYAFYN